MTDQATNVAKENCAMAMSFQHKASQDLGPIEEIPAWQRIDRLPASPWIGPTQWAEDAVWSLAEAAGRHTPPFVVGAPGFKHKLLKEAQVAVAYRDSQVKAVAAVTSLIYLRRTGLLARYASGTMVDRTFRELKTGVSFSSLFRKLDEPRADIIVGHTQSPRMVQTLWAQGLYGFPGPEGGLPPLDGRLQEDLAELLLTIGRRPDFDPVSGLVPGCYDETGCLYSTEVWPLPGSQGHASFRTLGRTDGVLVLSSSLASTADLGLVRLYPREVPG